MQEEDRERDVGGRPSFARDHISRGWDVFEITARHPWHFNDHVINVYAVAKYFLRHGPFQGNKDVGFLDLPITVWGQRGYGSDLAQYYKKVNSWGFELEIGSF